MIKIIKSSYLEDHWKRYPETEIALRDWLCKVQSTSCKTLNDFIQNFPKTVWVAEDVLNFRITSSVYLLASFNTDTLIIRGIGTLYSAFGRSN
jgi:mRNA-degrading endonuclease HigB of HigAB toxin-antitoxin module